MNDDDRRSTWERDGYLVIRDAIAGELPSLYEGEPFGRRYVAMREHIEEPGSKLFDPTELTTNALYNLYTHPAITDMLSDIVGTEVSLHEISAIRVKLPDTETKSIPWHQDSHYYNEEALGKFATSTEHMRVIKAWTPLVDVDVDNGCLWFIPASHH